MSARWHDEFSAVTSLPRTVLCSTPRQYHVKTEIKRKMIIVLSMNFFTHKSLYYRGCFFFIIFTTTKSSPLTGFPSNSNLISDCFFSLYSFCLFLSATTDARVSVNFVILCLLPSVNSCRPPGISSQVGTGIDTKLNVAVHCTGISL